MGKDSGSNSGGYSSSKSEGPKYPGSSAPYTIELNIGDQSYLPGSLDKKPYLPQNPGLKGYSPQSANPMGYSPQMMMGYMAMFMAGYMAGMMQGNNPNTMMNGYNPGNMREYNSLAIDPQKAYSNDIPGKSGRRGSQLEMLASGELSFSPNDIDYTSCEFCKAPVQKPSGRCVSCASN
ncbi:MAG: hypothetical protein KKA79_05905 [Nanoarchaeota archaeon]|nr:hypothetical protein [Nanoarchaeota archaeon]MCG2718996.1 hypothetical protein [Nanoarchaeota archaeon]